MKKFLSKMTAVAAATILSISSFASYSFCNAADTEEKSTVVVSFDISGEGITIEDPSIFDPIEVEKSFSIIIPEGELERDGFYMTGWTYDDIHAYQEGDVFYPPNEEDVTLHPVWTSAEKKPKTHVLSYYVEIDGEVMDISEILPDKKYAAGKIIKVPIDSISRNGYSHLGWEYQGTPMRGNEKFIMPDEDVVVVPHWLVRRNLIYTTAGADRIVGLKENIVDYAETLLTSLANSDRFARIGFNLVGWHCDYDDKIYKPLDPFVVPKQDVTFTAVWEPKNYTIVFKQSSKSAEFIKIQGKTDETITVPEATITKEGYKLSGWNYNDTFYPVGSDFVIPGAMPGLGIALDAVWVKAGSSDAELYGDANADGKTDISDAVLIMQYLANPEKYQILDAGLANADCVDSGKGITASDALAIQMIEAKTITVNDLPITNEKLNEYVK